MKNSFRGSLPEEETLALIEALEFEATLLTLSNIKKATSGFIIDDLRRAICKSTKFPITLHGKWDCLYNFSGGMKLRTELLQIYAVVDVSPQNFLIGDRWTAFAESIKKTNEYSGDDSQILKTVPRNLHLEYRKLDGDHMRNWFGRADSHSQSLAGPSSEFKTWDREYMLDGV